MRRRRWAMCLPTGAFLQFFVAAPSWFSVDFSCGAGAAGESRERIEDFLAVHLGFPLAESGNIEKLVHGTRTPSAQLIERRVVHHHISRTPLLLRRGAAPLTKIFPKFRVNSR